MISSTEIKKEIDRLKKEVKTEMEKAMSGILNSPEVKAIYSAADVIERASKGKGVPIFSEYIDLHPEYSKQEQFGQLLDEQIKRMGYVNVRPWRDGQIPIIQQRVYYNPDKNMAFVSECDVREGGELSGTLIASDHSIISEEVKALNDWYEQFVKKK
jgi:hypothetical protein